MIMSRRLLSALALSTCLGTSLLPISGYADTADLKSMQAELMQQRAKLEAQQRTIDTQLRALQASQNKLQKQMQRIQELDKQVSAALGGKPSNTTAIPSGHETANAVKPSSPSDVGTERVTEEMAKPMDITTLSEEGGVLLSRGQFMLEPALEYTRSSALRVAIEGFTVIPALSIGSFDISQIDRDTYSASVGARYGLTNRIEVNAKVPYVYRNDSALSRPIGTGTGVERLTDVSGDSIGDAEFGGSYQITNGKGGWPFLVANLRFKTATGTNPFEVPIDPNTGLQLELPTGSGFYAIQPSITAIIPSDPVVFFGNLGYLHNFAKDFGGTIGEIEPGDGVSSSFGMGLGINDKTSFNIGYSHTMVFETRQNGFTIPTSDVLQIGALDFGFSYKLTPEENLNFTVSAGLTADAPDVRLVFRTPMRLSFGE